MFLWRGVHTSRSKVTPTDAPSKLSAAGIGPPAILDVNECCFAALPQHLLEAILAGLKDEMGRGNTKDIFCAVGVCKSWRAAGHALFFKDSWGSGMQTASGPAIQHPAQLITLCPLQHSPGGHIKCYMHRELLSSGLSGKVYRYVLSQGVDYAKANGKFLLAAVQAGQQSINIYLDRTCSGKPVSSVSANLMRTTYTLYTAASSGGSSSSSSSSNRRRRSSSSSSTGEQKQQAARDAEQRGMSDSRTQEPGWCGCALCSSNGAGAASAAAAAAAPQELAGVAYKLRVRGIMLPRRMRVSIPAPQQQHQLQQPAAAVLKACTTGYRQDHLLLAAAAAAAGTEHQQDTAAPFDQQVPPAAALAAGGFSRSSSAPLPLQQQQQQQQLPGLDLHAAADRGRCFSDRSLPRGLWQLQQHHQQQLHHSPSFRTALQLQCQRARHCPPHLLHNKQPHWNEALRCWCLNFRGRVRLASVKNFQLVTDPDPPRCVVSSLAAAAAAAAAGPHGSAASSSSNGVLSTPDASSSSSNSRQPASVPAEAVGGQAERPDGSPEAGQAALSGLTASLTPTQGLLLLGSAHTGGVVTQFGKVDRDVYILDYDPVLITGLQAFAVALTSFGTKVLL